MMKNSSNTALTDASHGMVFSIKKYSLHDGPGIRTTVFLKGCPLRCWWCHNPESQNLGVDKVTDAESRPFSAFNSADGSVGRIMRVEEVMAEVMKDELFYDESGGGVTFSGGEPLMQPVFLSSLLEAARRYELHTTVDTSGYSPKEALESVIPLTDLWLFDLKLMDDAAHRRYVGTPVQPVLDNLDVLAQSGASVAVRVPVVPGITDTRENIEAIALFLSQRPSLKEVALLPLNHLGDAKYRRLGMENRIDGLKPPADSEMGALKQYFSERGFQVKIGG